MFAIFTRKQVSNSIMILKAPNGKPSNLTAEQYSLVRTPQFKAWFGDWEKLAMAKLKDAAMDEVTLANLSKDVSKVVDENGEPLVCYHISQSSKKFTEFQKTNPNDNLRFRSYAKEGFYFTSASKQDANQIWNRSKKGRTYEVFLNVKNILDLGNKNAFDYKANTAVDWKSFTFEMIEKYVTKGIEGGFDISTNKEYAENVDYVWIDSISEADIEKIEKLGYSGIWGDKDKQANSEIAELYGTDQIVVFKSNQIKLADGTNTTFDSSNPDIRYDNGGNMKAASNGTITVGPSHDDGGIPVYNKGTNQMLEVEGGEGIINKRSMALNKKVTFNGEKMTPCEAASEINQMAGGVAYDCDNTVSSKEKYDMGGEFARGRKMESEHKKTLNSLYEQDITPTEAIDEIVKEHLSENPKYYSTEGKWTPARRKKPKCSCDKKYYDLGGITDDFDFGLGSLDSFVNSKIRPADRDTPDQEIIDWTITKGRELLDTDIIQQILKNVDSKWKPYFMTYQKFNLYKLGWRLQFGSSRQWAGLCSWDGKTSKNIYISIEFVKHDKNWQQNAIDTILHEIAHACVTEGIISKVGQSAFKMIDPMYAANTGHGESWKSICQAINPEGDCSVFYTKSDMKPSFRPFKYECANCRDKGYGNKWGFTSTCFKCFKPVIVTKNN